ncbi:MAG: hypothetical protein GXO88_02555 [Chlorobi bacterium]|nr:hypothetical protein [Chlorobiota bacterium]
MKSTVKIIILITAMILFGGEYSFSQNVNLDKNDPIFILIAARAASDLKQSAERSSPETAANKTIAEKMVALNDLPK